MRSDWYKSKEVQQRESKHMIKDKAKQEIEAREPRTENSTGAHPNKESNNEK